VRRHLAGTILLALRRSSGQGLWNRYWVTFVLPASFEVSSDKMCGCSSSSSSSGSVPSLGDIRECIVHDSGAQ
jgi:hypothetical protein